MWRLEDGIPVGEPLADHEGAVTAVATGTLADGTPAIVSGSWDGMVWLWRLEDGTPVVPPLELPGPVRSVAVHGELIVTVTAADVAVHQPGI